MTKIMTMPSKENLKAVLPYSDAILIGIKDMCVNIPGIFTMEEVKGIVDLCKEKEIEVFLSLNKNMHTNDLEPLKDILSNIDTLSLEGIFYYDISLVEFKKELQFQTPLVWSQEHLTTNYATMNYWHSKGIKYTYVSSEITLDEIEMISKETAMNLIVPIFGYLPMFVSKRNLINNYKKYFHLQDTSNHYELEKEDRRYPIDNTNLGTVVYSSSILNGLKEFERLENLGVSYVTLNSYRIPEEQFVEVTKLFFSRNYQSNKIDEMFTNTDKGFLYKETIYRVKKNEKK